MTQNERVLARLRQGPFAAVEFQPPNICDGGPPIWRVAARVNVLKHRGFVIRSDRRPDGTAIYHLIFDPELPKPSGESRSGIALPEVDPCKGMAAPSQTGTDRPPVTGALFDADTFSTPPSYRDQEAA